MARVNNLPTGKKYEVEPGELGGMIELLDGFRGRPPVKKSEPEKIAERLDEYFCLCSENDIIPTVEAMAVALGVSRISLWKWQQDADSEAGQLIDRAKELINALIASMSAAGKCNVIYSIWQQKNHFGYTDTKTVEVKGGQHLDDKPLRTVEEIAADMGVGLTEFRESTGEIIIPEADF